MNECGGEVGCAFGWPHPPANRCCSKSHTNICARPSESIRRCFHHTTEETESLLPLQCVVRNSSKAVIVAGQHNDSLLEHWSPFLHPLCVAKTIPDFSQNVPKMRRRWSSFPQPAIKRGGVVTVDEGWISDNT